MDLKQFDTVAASNVGFELQLVNPSNGEELPIFITVLGRDSDEFRKLQAELNRRRLNKLARSGRHRSTDDDFEADGVQLLAVCTKAWRDGDKPKLTIDGEELECNRANAARVYSRFPWIKDQVDAAVLDRANFTSR